MATEFFGYQRTGNAIAQVVSSEYATISAGGGAISLVQQFQADYQQEIRPVFAVGDANLYWVTGHPQGSLSIVRMAGKSGFFSSFKAGACGRVDSISVNASKGQVCAGNVGGGGTVTFTGGMIQGLQLNMQAGRVEIMEGVTIKVASLNV